MADDRAPAVQLAESVLADAANLLGIPTNSLKAAARWLGKRMRVAREVLIDELARGETRPLELAEQDEAIGMIVRYVTAARDGRARLNLRLLASLIHGVVADVVPLRADNFHRFAPLLEDLTQEEVFLLARLATYQQDGDADPGDADETPWQRALSELVPDHFPTPEYLKSVAASASRTGFLQLSSGYDVHYNPSPLLAALRSYVDFEAVLRREGLEDLIR